MTTTKKRFSLRIISLVSAMVLLLTGAFATTAFAAGEETLEVGYNDIGSFTFTDTNTTLGKTIQGTQATFVVSWRIADGVMGAPDVDAGLGDVKLTLKVFDADTGEVLAGPQTFYRENTDDAWYITDEITVNLGRTNRRVKVWFDASSLGASNGNYRSIHVRAFEAYVS